MNLKEKKVRGERVYAGRIIDVELDDIILPDGGPAKREVVRHPGGVTILPVADDGTITLVRQWRYAFMEETLEAPAGKLEPGEDPLEAAVRELKEETGITAEKVIPLGYIYPSPGYTSERLYLYLALGITQGDACPDQDEFLTTVRMSLDEAVELAMEGKIPDSKTVCLLLKARRLLDK